MKDFERDCIEAELNVSAAQARNIIESVSSEYGCTYGNVVELNKELQRRIGDELLLMTYFSLTSEEAGIYKKPQKEWEEIVLRFPKITTDLEEAKKCFALSRYAAAVYHSIQVIELGLVYLNEFMKSTDHQRGWNAAIRDLDRILKTPREKQTDFEKLHFKFFQQLQPSIESLKSAWRDKISHASERLTLMTSEFHPEVAKDILDATRIFMRRLAIDLPTAEV